jgi:hypothetical protein
VVEGVVHMLHVIHHVHVATSTLDLRQLLDVRVLVVAVGGVAHVVSSLGRHGAFLVVTHLKVRQLLLRFYWLLLGWVNVRYFRLFVGEVTHCAHFVWVLAVLWERVGEVSRAHSSRLLRHCVLLLQHVFLLSDLSKPGVLKSLRGGDPVISVVNEQFLNEVDDFGTGLGNKFSNASAFNSSEAELCEVHVWGVSLEFVKKDFVGCAEDVVNLVHLIQLVVAWEKGEKGNDFKHDTADAP